MGHQTPPRIVVARRERTWRRLVCPKVNITRLSSGVWLVAWASSCMSTIALRVGEEGGSGLVVQSVEEAVRPQPQLPGTSMSRRRSTWTVPSCWVHGAWSVNAAQSMQGA